MSDEKLPVDQFVAYVEGLAARDRKELDALAKRDRERGENVEEEKN